MRSIRCSDGPTDWRGRASGRWPGIFKLIPCAVLAACAFALSGCQPLPTYSYILRVTIDTPDGPAQGESVIKVTAYQMPHILPNAGGPRSRAQGEAVIVKTQKKTLFLLLGNKLPGSFANNLALYNFGIVNEYNNYAERVNELRKTRNWMKVSPKLYPKFAIFRDKNKPETVSTFDPSQIGSVMGDSYKIKNIEIIMTRKHPVSKILKELPWLQKIRGLENLPPSWSDNRIDRSFFITV